MTNLEWVKTFDAEEMAKLISRREQIPRKVIWLSLDTYAAIKSWLKEEHEEENE